jgi:hypothetical protein
MPPTLTRHLRALLIRQHNVVARWQLPLAQRRAAVRAAQLGQWRRLSYQVFLAAPGSPSTQQLAWAALLHCGEHARLSGRTALVLHGWQQELRSPHDVVVPGRVQPLPGPPWVRIHRVTGAPDGPQALPLRTSPHMATACAAAWARTDREAMFIVISVLQQGLTSPARLRQTLASTPALRRRQLIGEMASEYADGSHSLNELDFARLCRRFGVPAPHRQTRVYDAMGNLRAIDAEFRTASGKRLRVEIEGLHHLDPAQYFADVDRHNGLALHDPATSLRITTWHLRHEPGGFMGDLRWAVLHG